MFKRFAALALLGLIALATSAHAAIPVRAQIDVTGYTIHTDLDPATGRMTATASVTFTALDDLNVVVFGLNNGLALTSIVDGGVPSAAPTLAPAHAGPVLRGEHHAQPAPAPAAAPIGSGNTLQYERNVTDSTVRVTPANIINKGTVTTWTFTYAGKPTVDTSPVDGIKFAQIADPVSILLYPGRWFPIAMPGLFTDRFTAQISVTVPKGETVVGSNLTGHKTLGDSEEFDFDWTKPGFPGTLVAGKFLPAITAPGINNIRVYVTDDNKDAARNMAVNTARAFEFMTVQFGNAESGLLSVVELPEDSVSAFWAPEVVAIKPSRASARLIANTVAHQWFGSEISPYTLNDAWITNGMSRYAELMFLEDGSGKQAFQNAITDTEAGALAYDTEPLTTLGRLDPFSPQFQDMTLEKGAMVFHMLRWEMGDEIFTKFLRDLLSSNADRGVRTSQVQKVAEADSSLQLTSFFSQWLDGTGAPDFTDNYSVFRLSNNKGFRTVGSVSQDLDLFSMPVEIRIETEGKSEDRRVDLSGTESRYSVETFGRPRHIVLDPDNWLLKSTPDLAVRVAVLRGQQDVAQGDLIGAISEYQKALDTDRGSSLANYRLAEVFMMQKNYQAAANSFRDALRGDLAPKWIEVWSHVNLGKIFDITGQRERAVNEYRQALQTNDNTQGAINEARARMQKPYKADDATLD
ncbi:tetratricopeptide repeat protein [Granulicella sp. 5B5]|uniref:M1 family aminopeptidase n=1 Tax=Granulicella sp. 5B5 TaxID=1617967 RepID=UPI0015F5BE26|nr:M1 family aminopeptidase [Granulicella sp. 5B5]QMV20195.1 tetratricopeptide repeat protein [Granulicella sp. 5B5]